MENSRQGLLDRCSFNHLLTCTYPQGVFNCRCNMDCQHSIVFLSFYWVPGSNMLLFFMCNLWWWVFSLSRSWAFGSFFFLQLQRPFPKRFDDCTVPSRLGFQRFHAVVVLFKGAFPFSSLLEETVVGCPCIYCTRSPLPKSSLYPMSFCCVFDTLVESGFSISSINFCL